MLAIAGLLQTMPSTSNVVYLSLLTFGQRLPELQVSFLAKYYPFEKGLSLKGLGAQKRYINFEEFVWKVMVAYPRFAVCPMTVKILNQTQIARFITSLYHKVQLYYCSFGFKLRQVPL